MKQVKSLPKKLKVYDRTERCFVFKSEDVFDQVYLLLVNKLSIDLLASYDCDHKNKQYSR